MKKKFICRLSAMLIAVLCVCLLCVPAFASDVDVILPETIVEFNEEGEAVVSSSSLFIVGQLYCVVWNGVEYICTAQDVSSVIGDGAVGIGDGSAYGFLGCGEPFIIVTDGVNPYILFLALDGSSSSSVSIKIASSGGSSSVPSVDVTIPLSYSNSEEGVLDFSLPLVAGAKYLVTYDAVEYVVTAKHQTSNDFSGVVLGNIGDFTDCPFVVFASLAYSVTLIDVYPNIPIGTTKYLTITNYEESIFDSIASFTKSLQIQLSATSVIEVLAYIAGAAVLGVFLWWGVRKGVKGIKCAYLRGKLRF